MDSHLKELFRQFQQQFGLPVAQSSSPASSLLKIEGISGSFIKALFRALGILYKSNACSRFKPNHVFGIRVGKDSDWSEGRQVFSYFQFVDLGFNAFRSEDDESIVSRGLFGPQKYIRSAPQTGFLRVVFKSDGDITPAYRKMVRDLSLEIILSNLSNSLKALVPVIDVIYSEFDGGFPMFRNPTLDEMRWLYACIKAMIQVHPLLKETDQGNKMKGFVDFVESVDVQWPADDPRAWDIVSVTVSLPPKISYQDHRPAMEDVAEDLEIDQTEEQSDDVVRRCEMCKTEVQSSRSSRCSRCKAVIYCSQMCQKRHWKDSHRSNCELYKAIMDREEELEFHQVFMFPCYIENPCRWLDSVGLHMKGMWRRLCNCSDQRPFGLLSASDNGIAGSWALDPSEFPSDSPILVQDGRDISPSYSSSMIPLSGWVEYYDLRSLPFASPVAALLSFPLTLYHIVSALSITSKNLLAKGREVVVHYLGPERELDWIPAFSEISHLLCGSGNVQIFMIGPEVPRILSGTSFSAGSKVSISLIQGLYQDEAHYIPPPQVVVSLNARLEDYSSWIGALDLIKSRGVATYFTDESELSCSNAKQILRASGLVISYPVTPNPFRSPLRMQPLSNNLPAFSNGFVFGVNS